jgi:hypothetical protein
VPARRSVCDDILGWPSRVVEAPIVVLVANRSTSHNGEVIVVVEGPSAAGKTSWCQLHAADFVAEYAPTDNEPDGSDLAAQADYWASVNSQRWLQAIDLERRSGLAICDSDPLKLHYSWSLTRIGEATWSRFEHDLDATRRAFSAGTLGFADLVMVSIPSPAVLHRQRDSDVTRRRHTFDLHSRLSEPLRDWYHAVATLDPRRVVWELPPTGMPQLVPIPRDRRSDVALLDRLVSILPS